MSKEPTLSKGIYWVYFSAGHNQLKLRIDAVGRATAKKEAIERAAKILGYSWVFEDIQCCR
jgi:hypothetical protein